MTKICLNCQERHIGCHSSCEKYINAKAAHDAKLNEKNKKKYQENQYYDYKNNAVLKAKRRRGLGLNGKVY